MYQPAYDPAVHQTRYLGRNTLRLRTTAPRARHAAILNGVPYAQGTRNAKQAIRRARRLRLQSFVTLP